MLLVLDIFYSFRSPYCYLLNERLKELENNMDITINIKPVYPLAIRDPKFFESSDPLRRAYHIRDAERVANFLGLPYRRPVPDPVVSDLKTDTIANEQPFIQPVTRMAVAASILNASFDFTYSVMNMMWNGSTDNWHEEINMQDAVINAGLNWEELYRIVEQDKPLLDSIINKNQQSQRERGHWGVPLMVLEGEPFYGQDRFPDLQWRIEKMIR